MTNEWSRREVMVLLSALGLAGGRASGAEEAAAGGKPYRVVLENERLRVLEYVSAPKGEACGPATHYHPAHLSIYLTPARIRGIRPDGTSGSSNERPARWHGSLPEATARRTWALARRAF